jgi:hypothetical protein
LDSYLKGGRVRLSTDFDTFIGKSVAWQNILRTIGCKLKHLKCEESKKKIALT